MNKKRSTFRRHSPVPAVSGRDNTTHKHFYRVNGGIRLYNESIDEVDRDIIMFVCEGCYVTAFKHRSRFAGDAR